MILHSEHSGIVSKQSKHLLDGKKANTNISWSPNDDAY